MSDTVTAVYSDALAAMTSRGPRAIHRLAALLAEDESLGDGAALLEHLQHAGPEDALRQKLAHALATWDRAETDAGWAAATPRNTAARRGAVIAALVVDTATAELIEDRFPYAPADNLVVIADDWDPWRTEARRSERDFYWSHYRDYLLAKNWSPDAVAALDTATEEVVGRLADPTAIKAYQSRGLVVGYVQSGKTANFTGVAAKAIDAGYRLVIVLTGTTNMLRAQTQRRMDIELCGRENIEREISAHDQQLHEYHNDPDWQRGRFIRHGGIPSESGHPDIHRLSTYGRDFRKLGQGFRALDFKPREPNRRFNHPANLFTSDARLVVAKKNSTVLKDLVADLGHFADRLNDVPVLIIDDESDQASVNTTSPKKWKADSKERTAINRLIGQLLRMMARAQYVGYTATPYANVFIDPSDVVDIFPRDFLVSLPRPVGYMGAEDFHDFDADLPLKERPLERSRERAHIRELSDDPVDDELYAALDMFVLTGAIKVYRERTGQGTFRHHTMLIHEAMHRESHRETAALVSLRWTRAGYNSHTGRARLRKLYEEDVRPVSAAWNPDMVMPADFDELLKDLGTALSRISPGGDVNASPVIVVNSDAELEKQQESLDFEKRDIWRILVGGNKLARGFTVEGLTVTYYRRGTAQVDTLMQMGRWFGFRPGYRDLVRLYTTPELHSMFAAACLDENYLRRELRRYATTDDGQSQITPSQIPPLIAQHRPDLRPTGRNKMWNARLVLKSSPGEPVEPVAYPCDAKQIRHNTELWTPLMARAVANPTELSTGASGRIYTAYVATATHAEVLAVLQLHKWMAPEIFRPELGWLESLGSDQLARWAILMPQQTRRSSDRELTGVGTISIFERYRTQTGSLNSISESRHRNAAMRIAGVDPSPADPSAPETAADSTAEQFNDRRTGALILYPNVDRNGLGRITGTTIRPEQVTIAFHMVTPLATTPRSGKLIKWATIDGSKRDDVVIDSRDDRGSDS